MSTKGPSQDPEDITQAVTQEVSRQLWESYRDYLKSLEERLAREDPLRSSPQAASATPPTQSGLSGWVTTVLQSVTLVTIVGCAFWLGSLSTTVSNTSQKLDKLSDGI